MIKDLIDAWPVKVNSISFIGHSMGGLVTRSACYYGAKLGDTWVPKTKRIFLLGSPSRGAPLEQIANITSFTLKKIFNPWTKLIAKIIESRSDGIKDLRYAFLRDDDWQDKDQSSLIPKTPLPVPLLEHVEYFIAIGSMWENVDHPMAKIFGDAMVTQFSARGQGVLKDRQGIFEDESVRVFAKVNHVALANNWDVNAQILEWWGRG